MNAYDPSEWARGAVLYDKREWSRGAAWDNLRLQQIPGRPSHYHERLRVWLHYWRKCHTATHWGWYWAGYDPCNGDRTP